MLVKGMERSPGHRCFSLQEHHLLCCTENSLLPFACILPLINKEQIFESRIQPCQLSCLLQISGNQPVGMKRCRSYDRANPSTIKDYVFGNS
ncbi:unnamed protein product [Allacma fusca]|uniref:Uncharacterized protein n=1 Tax=Allacma fusca TaxID=39272 RepID=A0A8J2L038_9HEXA|nr:unnamed protein product [Allacma fusca]